MSGPIRNLMVGAVAALTAFAVFLVILVTATGSSQAGCASSAGASQPAASRNAVDQIPRNYLSLYQKAGQQYGIPWNVLAGIGKVESGHGQNMGPSSAGALGPMQFMPATWAIYGVDGNGDGRRDIMNPADAIPGAANYLKHSGAPGDLRKAIWAYNHSTPYYLSVMAAAKQYADGNFSIGGDNTAYTGCTAAGPALGSAGPVAQKVIAFAYAQLGTPYYYGGTCTNPQKYYTSTNCDCSSLTMMAYRHAGITIPRTSDLQYWYGPRVPNGQEQPGDLVFFDFKPGHSGPGHVGIVYDVGKGLMIAAPHTGASVRIQSYRYYPGGVVGFTRPATHK
jgi:cell wall-associated NlpC family hydrolase